MKKVLVSGFEPFNGLTDNVSQELVNLLPESLHGLAVKGIVLPVSFKSAFLNLKEVIGSFRPDYVVATGLAVSRDHITVERIAINVMDAKGPDNDGEQPQNLPIYSDGEDGLFSQLPVVEMVRHCNECGVKASISNTAGAYVCNQVMYQLIHMGRESGFKAGFVHLPPHEPLSENGVFVPLEDQWRGFQSMLKALC